MSLDALISSVGALAETTYNQMSEIPNLTDDPRALLEATLNLNKDTNSLATLTECISKTQKGMRDCEKSTIQNFN